jgi:hypothetical protein
MGRRIRDPASDGTAKSRLSANEDRRPRTEAPSSWEESRVHPALNLQRNGGGSRCHAKAYLDNIKAKTGKSADDFRKLAEKKKLMEHGKLRQNVKEGGIVKWLKDDFELGHGHAMAIYAVLKGAPVASKN